LFFLEVQSFVSPTASRLLFGIAQKVTKKARHRTRWSDSHRANRTALCFSARRGCSDSTSMYCFAIAAIHRRDPAGFLPPRLRCSAPRTAPLIHESVHPCTASTCCSGELLLLRQDAAQQGPPEAWRGCEGKVRSRAHRMCARSLNVHGRTSSEPRSTLADLEGRMPGRRAAGGVFLWLPFFAQAKKVTRSPQASGSFALGGATRSLAGRVEALHFWRTSQRSDHPKLFFYLVVDAGATGQRAVLHFGVEETR
jgi:hypothetical protein